MATTAESQVWEHHKEDVVILVNPAKQKNLIIAFAMSVMILCGTVELTADNSPLMKWAREQDQQADRAQLAPTMERLAANGKRDAVIWVARNEPEKDGGRLAALAVSGDGEALFLQAKAKANTDAPEAQRLLELSADAGYLPAVKNALHVHRHKIAKWE